MITFNEFSLLLETKCSCKCKECVEDKDCGNCSCENCSCKGCKCKS